MSDALSKRIQRLLASACLLTSTGCASFMSSLSSDYAELPSAEQSASEMSDAFPVTAAQAPPATDQQFLKPLGSPEFAHEAQVDALFAQDVAETEASVNPFENPQPGNPFEDVRPDNPFAGAVSDNPFIDHEVDSSGTLENPEAAWPANEPEVDAFNPFAATEQGSQVETASAEWPVDQPDHFVDQVSHQYGGLPAPVFHPAEPRMPTPQQACPPCDVTIAAAGPEQAAAYPDEFIYDGGDRDLPVHYNGGVMSGLDTEDTVVEYKDIEGGNHVTASNRVAVYAPRFGSVRTVSGPGVGTKVDQAAGAVDFAGVGGLKESRGIGSTASRTPAEGLRMRASASGVDTALPASISRQASTPAVNRKVDQGFESRVNTGLGTLEMTDIRVLSLQIVDAATSTIRTSSVQNSGSTQATQTYATFRAQTTVGVEENGRDGEIFLTKKAKPLIAQPGDTVSFTIQFQNIGDYPVGEVRIIDNLTPRLAYVGGTGQITISTGGGGSLTAVPNKEGSQMVEFRLDEALPGGASGTITFDAIVR